MFALCMILGGYIFGSLFAKFATSLSDRDVLVSVAGSAGVALVIILFQKIGRDKPGWRWRHTIPCFLATVAFSLLVDRFIGNRVDWTRFRWAVCAAPAGLLIGGFYLSAVRPFDGLKFDPKAPDLVTNNDWANLFISLITSPIRMFVPDAWSTLAAAVFGGSIGGGIVGAMMSLAAREDVANVFGNYWAPPIVGALMGGFACAPNGWSAWSLRSVVEEQ
jgi:hypothetical protein